MTETETRVPEMVGWEITRRCNLTCDHCYTAASGKAAARAPREIDPATCVRLLDDFAALGTQVIGWTGGEPLLRDDLEALVAHAAGLGIETGITTNGVLLDERRVASLAEAGLGFVQVSLDGSTPERNAAMRGATAEQFELILAGVRACRDAGLPVYMAMVLGAGTLDDAPRYLDLAASLGVTAVRFCGFVPAGRGRAAGVRDRLAFDRLDALRAFVEELSGRTAPRALLDPAFGPLPPAYAFHECMAGRSTMYLSASGDVYPCTSLIHPRFVVGNVTRTPLAEIWADTRMTTIAAVDPASIGGRCRGCDHFDDCHGACRGVTFAHTGEMTAGFPVCLR